jgi:Zn-dependent peptidase ImmA (M78 family)
MKTRLEINGDILIWAIERAGFEVGEFSEKFPHLSAWLAGKKKPTLKQLKTFSQKVHIPFGYLFLGEPIVEQFPIPFFRTLQDGSNKLSLNVYDTILILQQRQNWMTEYLQENGYEQLSFVGKFSQNNDIQEIVDDIRKTLNLENNWASKLSNWTIAKEFLTERVEDIGIFPVFNSIVGSNTHRPIKVEECRGFVLVDKYAPFMFINSADSIAAQIFTLAHELAHIWLGKSAGFDFRQLLPANDPTEIFCDKIAAEFLVPQVLISEALLKTNAIEELAKLFKVSQLVIVRRLLDLKKISRDEFLKFYEDYRQREFKKKESKSSGGDFYNTGKKRLGLRFVNYVYQAVQENKLLVRDAYQLTDLSGNTFHKFMKEHLY